MAAAVTVWVAMFALGARLDYDRLMDKARTDAQTTVITLREHLLKSFATQEILIHQIDRRIEGMNAAQVAAFAPALSEELGIIQRTLPDVSSIALTNAEGMIEADSAGKYRAQPISIVRREFWSAQRDGDAGTFISRPYRGSQTQVLNFAMSRRRTTEDGSFRGTIHIANAVHYFYDFWREVLGQQVDSTVLLLRSDGDVLARYPAVAGDLPRLTKLNSPMVRNMESAPQNGTYVSVSNIDHIERIHAYQELAPYPLTIFYGISLHAVMLVWWQDVAVLGIACIVASGALVAAMLFARRQSRALSEFESHRAKIQEAAQASQRLAILGRLTAGIAHDFRNIMQAISGGVDLLDRGVGDPDRVRIIAGRIGRAAERGGDLTLRMLDFARGPSAGDAAGPAPDAGPHNPAEAVTAACQLVGPTLRSGIRLRFDIVSDGLPGLVMGDRAGLEAALINLVMNARDAMPAGGQIMVRLAGERIGSIGYAEPGHLTGLPAGEYARLSIHDDGTGMTQAVLERAAEAFFTTKPRGEGIGLGLAAARSYAEGAGGMLLLDSIEGRGTTVTLWLRAAGIKTSAAGVTTR